MGQGTESCGGYEIEYDPYEEGLEKGVWTARDGSLCKVEDMSGRRLNNTIGMCERLSAASNFSCDSEKWNSWVSILGEEVWRRSKAKTKKPTRVAFTPEPKPLPKKARGSMVELVCHCGKKYTSREADLKRGWGLSCSKRCAAIRREYGRPKGKRV